MANIRPNALATAATSAAADDYLLLDGATNGTRKMLAAGVASVSRYFAVGRVPGTTDDTAAITTALAAHKTVFFPDGAYVMSAAVPLQSGQSIIAWGGAEITWAGVGDYPGFFVATDKVDIRISGLSFIGTGVEAGVSSSPSGDRGAAIRGRDCRAVMIDNCRFGDFVLANADNGIISFAASQQITVQHCRFSETNIGGTDISMHYRVGDLTVFNNKSWSDGDKFLYISSVGGEETLDPASLISKTAHHYVTHNTFLANGGRGQPTGRHGIAVHYKGGVSYAYIALNTLVGGKRSGIYLRGADSDAQTGPSQVINNTIRFFGGGELSGGSFWGIGSGIHLESSRGALIAGNVIEDIGYYPDGTVRPVAAAGIGFVRQNRDCTIRDNIIRRVNGRGISVEPTVNPQGTTYNVENLRIVDNTIEAVVAEAGGAGGDPLVAFTHQPTCIWQDISSTRTIKAPTYRGNMLRSSVANAILFFFSGSGGAPHAIIEGNKFFGAGSAQGQTGLAFNSGYPGIILNNEFEDVEFCIRNRTALNGTDYYSHREWGSTIQIRGNVAMNCGALGSPQNLTSRNLNLVDPSNLYINTPRPVTAPPDWNQVVEGRVIGHDGTNILVEMFLTAVPISRQYYKGDRVLFPTPDAGGNIGAVCTVSGEPGVWKTYGAIEA